MIDNGLCGCGNGLRAIKYCALGLGILNFSSATAALTPMLSQAEDLLKAVDIAAAQAFLLQFLELMPGREYSISLFYRLLREQNWLARAEAVIRRVVAINRNNFWVTNELTLMLLNKGALGETGIHQLSHSHRAAERAGA